MTWLTESQLMAGVQPIYADIKFDTQSSTFGGRDGGNAGGLVSTGSLSYVHSLSDDLKFGLTAGSCPGLGIKFNDTWAGRYYIRQRAGQPDRRDAEGRFQGPDERRRL